MATATISYCCWSPWLITLAVDSGLSENNLEFKCSAAGQGHLDDHLS